MNALPRIAVLMPAYDPGPEIALTLASLRSQDVPFRLFVVDDGSTAKPDYARLLAGIDHQLIELGHNVGVNEVRNPALAAILAGAFDYIALIDCGDEMMPGRLAAQSAYLDSHPGVDIVGSQVELCITQTGSRSFSAHPREHESIAESLWVNLPLTHPALMIRSRVFQAIGPYSPQYEAAEDYDLCRRAERAGFRFHNLDAVLLRKIETAGSVSWRKRRAQLRSRARIQWAYRDLRKPNCVKGLVKTAMIRALPDGIAMRVKKILARGR